MVPCGCVLRWGPACASGGTVGVVRMPASAWLQDAMGCAHGLAGLPGAVWGSHPRYVYVCMCNSFIRHCGSSAEAG